MSVKTVATVSTPGLTTVRSTRWTGDRGSTTGTTGLCTGSMTCPGSCLGRTRPTITGSGGGTGVGGGRTRSQSAPSQSPPAPAQRRGLEEAGRRIPPQAAALYSRLELTTTVLFPPTRVPARSHSSQTASRTSCLG